MQNFQLDCFEYPFVGLHGCNLPEPCTGLYVNDLPGLNIVRFSQLTDPESPRIQDKFKAIHRQALESFLFDIDTALSMEDVEIDSLNGDMLLLGELGDGSSCTQYEKVGYRFYRNNCNDPLTVGHVSYVQYIPCKSGTIKATIVDGGVEVKSFLQAVNAGEVTTTRFDYSSLSPYFDVFIGCDIEILDEVCDSCSCYHKSCNCYGYSCNCFTAAPLVQKPGFSIVEKVNSNGMRICGACICDPTLLFCKYRKQLAVPFKYRLGIEILNDAKESDNLTPFTTCGQDSIDRLLGKWVGRRTKEGFIPGEYTTAKKRVLSYIAKTAKNITSDCINCTGVHFQRDVY